MPMLNVFPAVSLFVLLTAFTLTAAADSEVEQRGFENQLTEQQRTQYRKEVGEARGDAERTQINARYQQQIRQRDQLHKEGQIVGQGNQEQAKMKQQSGHGNPNKGSSGPGTGSQKQSGRKGH